MSGRSRFLCDADSNNKSRSRSQKVDQAHNVLISCQIHLSDQIIQRNTEVFMITRAVLVLNKI